jgi:hypothetical protein
MPSFLAHWYVLIETARRGQDVGSDLGSLIIDRATLQRRASSSEPTSGPTSGTVWDTGPLPRVDADHPGSDISAMAYLGALAPDIPSFRWKAFWQKISGKDRAQQTQMQAWKHDEMPWSRLLHTNRSGDFLLSFLEQLASVPSPALRSQALAFAMGYLSHIATDIALHPYINALAACYPPRAIPGWFLPLDTHAYVELCLDEYLATIYFRQHLHSWFQQMWGGYIEPAAQRLTTANTIATQTMTLLTNAASSTYGLNEEQAHQFRTQYLAGARGLRSFLAGRGVFSWLPLNALLRQRKSDPIIAILHVTGPRPDVTTLDEVLDFAVSLSERLCRRAINYYTSLRNAEASREEREQRRAELCYDLRNWDLNTGYTLDVSFDQEITLCFLHNWIYFADLWPHKALTL